jgi:hypothetical protein
MYSSKVITAFPEINSEFRWTQEKAKEWQNNNEWIVGCNYIPATAINQLEMFQPETFDLPGMNQELGWARAIGFNSVRVFLHHLLWEQDPQGFLQRLDQFLTIANAHDIKPMFVLFDGVWDPYPKLGKQPDPKLNVHNSGWVQSPGYDILKDNSQYDNLRNYIEGVVGHFRNDERILMWDIFNEPDNMNIASYKDDGYGKNKAELALHLLKKTFSWIRALQPIQPLTAAPWQGDWSDDFTLSELDRYMFFSSDIITFHSYENKQGLKEKIQTLKRFGRPMICTEYMARPFESTFKNILPIMKQHNVGAFNWGLVAGKTQTHCPWESWETKEAKEPEIWFHDIFYPNGEPYDKAEFEFLKEITKKDSDDEIIKVA